VASQKGTPDITHYSRVEIVLALVVSLQRK
jgi:hypothetical protein